jgi:hypothetical protein
MTRTRPAFLLGAVPALALAFAPTAAFADHGGHEAGGRHHGHDLIRSDLTPAVPTDDPIDGVAPGGAPWVIDRGEVRVRSNGRTDVRIEGLQIPRNGGTDNPIASIDAVLYCAGAQVADSGPQPMTVPGGDARFRVFLDVPRVCEAPTVLISPSTAVGKAFIASAIGR